MNFKYALQIDGFTQPLELEWLAKQASKRNTVIEIGSWMGRSTRAMADNMEHGALLYAVDTWRGSAGPKEVRHQQLLADKPEDWLANLFQKNMEGSKIPVIMEISESLEAAKQFAAAGKKFDMIFIDAAHDYDNVKADILAWRPLLAPGGLLCGHDFDGGRPGVVKAVRELIAKPRMAGAGSIWYAE